MHASLSNIRLMQNYAAYSSNTRAVSWLVWSISLLFLEDLFKNYLGTRGLTVVFADLVGGCAKVSFAIGVEVGLVGEAKFG